MKITKKIQKSIVKDPLKLTKREFTILLALAENEIRKWSLFAVNLQKYGQTRKGDGASSKGNIKKHKDIS